MRKKPEKKAHPTVRLVLTLFLLAFVAIGLGACTGGRGKTPAPGKPYAGKLVKQHGGQKTRPDPLEKRFIVLAYTRTKEKISLTYYHDGDYDPAAMHKIRALMRDRHTNEIGPIDPELIDFLVDIRNRLSLPATVTFDILSGYRSRATNETLRATNGQVAKESLHMYGYAVDFRVQGVSGGALAEIAKTMQRGGVSFYPSDNHVHVDIGNIRSWATK